MPVCEDVVNIDLTACGMLRNRSVKMNCPDPASASPQGWHLVHACSIPSPGKRHWRGILLGLCRLQPPFQSITVAGPTEGSLSCCQTQNLTWEAHRPSLSPWGGLSHLAFSGRCFLEFLVAFGPRIPEAESSL